MASQRRQLSPSTTVFRPTGGSTLSLPRPADAGYSRGSIQKLQVACAIGPSGFMILRTRTPKRESSNTHAHRETPCQDARTSWHRGFSMSMLLDVGTPDQMIEGRYAAQPASTRADLRRLAVRSVSSNAN